MCFEQKSKRTYLVFYVVVVVVIYFQQEVIHNLILIRDSIQDEVSRSVISKLSGRAI